MERYVCAVDVGTGSARAGVFDRVGTLLGRAEHPIQMHRPQADHAEHDSRDIWNAVCHAVRGAVARANVPPDAIAGISFDATCSIVVCDGDGGQVSVSAGGETRWDTIVWLDHRALAEADECTASRHRVLDYLGGVMSPEMATPKLMWLKRHMPASWKRASHIFDLADYLAWRASGSLARSLCTLTCKWTYLAHENPGWQRDFFAGVGLDDIFARAGLPETASPVGSDLGPLTAQSARELGLTSDCRVATGVIDAYAGALGVIGGLAGGVGDLKRHLALIAGTSSCVMAMSPTAEAFVGGWGPYYGAALPDCWIAEGGQSATGALLDHIIRLHGAGGEPTADRHRAIAERIMAVRAEQGLDLAGRLHVLPDFHGNRSPLADPHALGVISGLNLDASFDSLCHLYWRTAVGIALGVRHILDTLNASGFVIDTLHVTGGHTKNPLLMELYADAVGCTVVEPIADEAVLTGTAALAATAAGLYPDVASACAGMRQPGRERRPKHEAKARFDHDYRVFLEMHRQRKVIDEMSFGYDGIDD